MTRRTTVVPSRLAWHEERFRAAEQNALGLQILTPPQLASRLAGGFLEAASRDTCHVLVRDALADLKFAELEQLREMPGAVKAICTTLMKVWDADVDLQALAVRAPRISDLARIEAYVRDHLPGGMMLQRELVSAAIANLKNVGCVLGSVTVRGFVFVAPCWRRLFLALVGSTSIEWHSIETLKEQLQWIQNSAIRSVVKPRRTPRQSSVVCATPKHEVIEALRWARQLIVSGRAQPHEIAIVASATEDWDEDFRVLVADSQLPLHLVHGRSATSTFPGQQAGSLATLLLEGGWKPPSPLSEEEPLALDNLTYGNLVHELLRETAASLEANGGFVAATAMQVQSALAEAARRIALDWELTKPLPPSLLWQRTLAEARDTALSALTWPLPKFKDQKTYVEVPFGGLEGGEDNSPWDRNALVAIPGLDLKLRGKIDRLDLDAKSTIARVIDYKTGRCPDEEPGLDDGKELQRCLYAVAVKGLLTKVTAVEAALLYPGPEGSLFSLPDPSAQTAELIHFLQLAEQLLRFGRSVFGAGAESRYNDLAFALPANADGVYFSQKAAARDAMVGDLRSLWGED